ncbi:hypothetical protein IFM89_002715 [Coptis chinensis]|uniref:Uncharacterized protein n=1 Tax=Coptis chinensis TaxID=261450 RepID=A0A835M737_9MAGN|nr:hypothetical protein IFM89_002715 [Coptis chinensis]
MPLDMLPLMTEASYSRFEEGRKAWTKLIAGTSDFAWQVIGSVDTQNHAVLKKALLQYIMAFPVALKCHVIYGANIAQNLKDLLEENDLAIVLDSNNLPRCIIEFISQSLQMLPLEDSKRDLLESKFTCFHEGIPICEQHIGGSLSLLLLSAWPPCSALRKLVFLLRSRFQCLRSMRSAITLTTLFKRQSHLRLRLQDNFWQSKSPLLTNAHQMAGSTPKWTENTVFLFSVVVVMCHDKSNFKENQSYILCSY